LLLTVGALIIAVLLLLLVVLVGRVIFRVVRPPEARAQTKVGQLDVTVTVDQNVVRLYVPVDKTHLVHRLNRTRQLCRGFTIVD
jgi:hypothetical protein